MDRDGKAIEAIREAFPAWLGGLFLFPAMMKSQNGITDIEGVEVGHHTDLLHATGCTVVICRRGAVGGVDVRGGAPGTRETDLLHPSNQVQQLHAVLLTGGSAFGLAAADGVMSYLEAEDVGFRVGPAVVPIVPAAVLFDLNLVASDVRPGPDEGRAACVAATTGAVPQGTVGAGTGATVGKALGMEHAIKGGIGTARIALPGGLLVAALVAVNSYGGVVDHRTGETVAGPRGDQKPQFYDSAKLLIEGRGTAPSASTGENTTIGVVATNASLTKEQANHLARVSHDGLALTVRPCHTPRDGDTIFAMATCAIEATPDLTLLGTAAVEATGQAVLNAVRSATGLGVIPSAKEWCGG